MNTRLARLLWQPDNWTKCPLLSMTALTVALSCGTGFPKSVDVECSDLRVDLCTYIGARQMSPINHLKSNGSHLHLDMKMHNAALGRNISQRSFLT